MDLTTVLTWLVASGGSIAVASWVFERLTWFQAQSSDKKEWIMFGASALIAVAARAVMVYVPADVLAQIAPWFELVVGIFATQFISKSFHKVDKQ